MGFLKLMLQGVIDRFYLIMLENTITNMVIWRNLSCLPLFVKDAILCLMSFYYTKGIGADVKCWIILDI